MSRFGSLDDPALTLLLEGIRIIDPGNGTDRLGDLAIVAGQIADPLDIPAGAERIDGKGLIAAPGFCDLHAHVREPGMERAETVASGARAAAKGGFTTVCVMPNTDPPVDAAARVTWLRERAEGAACRVQVIAAATAGRAGEEMSDLRELAAAGIVGLSDDGAAIASEALARELLTTLAPLGLPLIEHAEDPTLAAGSLMRAGATATRLGLAGWPASAELAIVERDIALADETDGWVHFTHLSTSGGLHAIRRAKERGIRVTCDVTPHHLALTDAWVAGWRGFAWEEPAGVAADPFGEPLDGTLAYDTACRVNPPLGSRDDALALLEGLADGTIDAVATDHAPHPPERKAVEFAAAAPGMIGLETALSLGLAAVEAGRLGLGRLLEALSARPAALVGETRTLAAGSPADLVVFDPAARWRVGTAALASASANTPLIGMELPGVVRMTVAGGRITYRDGLELSGHACGATAGRMWDHAHRPFRSERCMSIRTNEELDPNEGPGFGCFVWQAILFAGLLFLIPVGLFTFNWPVWLLVVLLLVDMVLLFFISMTSVFLLRVFFADRRRGRGRTIGATQPPRVITTEAAPEERAEAQGDEPTNEGEAE